MIVPLHLERRKGKTKQSKLLHERSEFWKTAQSAGRTESNRYRLTDSKTELNEWNDAKRAGEQLGKKWDKRNSCFKIEQ